MKNTIRRLTVGSLFLCLSLTTFAERDPRYQLFDDWKTHGYVLSIEDTGPMSMSFSVACRPKDVYFSALRLLPKLGFFIQNKNEADGAYGISTDWKTNAVGGFGAFLTGVNAARVRFVLGVYDSPAGSLVQAKAELEISDNSTWRAETSTRLRDDIRFVVVTLLARPIYGNYDEVGTYLADYAKGDETVLTREQFWKSRRLAGFKGFDDPSSAPSLPAPVPSAPGLSISPGIVLKGQVKYKEIGSIASVPRPIFVSLAEDEAGTRVVQLDAGGSVCNLGSSDCMILGESIKSATRLRDTLKPGESETVKELSVGNIRLQAGAKVSTGNPPVRSLLLYCSEGSSSSQKYEITGNQAKSLADSLDRGNAFFQGREALREGQTK